MAKARSHMASYVIGPLNDAEYAEVSEWIGGFLARTRERIEAEGGAVVDVKQDISATPQEERYVCGHTAAEHDKMIEGLAGDFPDLAQAFDSIFNRPAGHA